MCLFKLWPFKWVKTSGDKLYAEHGEFRFNIFLIEYRQTLDSLKQILIRLDIKFSLFLIGEKRGNKKKNYSFKENSNSKMFHLIYWTFVLPFVSSLSLISNGINVKVFYSITSINVVYKYMLYNSLSNMGYLLTVVFVFVMKCGHLCDIKDTYFAKFYHHYIFIYASNSIAVFGILIEIIITIQRIFFIRNKSSVKNWPINYILAFLLIFSFIINLPNVIAAEIKPIWSEEKNSTIYVREPKMFFKKNPWIKIFIGMLVGLRLFLILVLLVVLNILMYYLFTEHVKKKNRLKNPFLKPKSDSSSNKTKQNLDQRVDVAEFKNELKITVLTHKDFTGEKLSNIS